MNDAAFEALADGDRRRLLSRLAAARDRDEPLSVPGEVVDDEHADRQAVEVRFRHVHLPKLAEHGYVTWDPSTGTVRPGPAFGDLKPLLTVLSDD